MSNTILKNRVLNSSRNAIEAIYNYPGPNGEGVVIIHGNEIITPQKGISLPSPSTPNGMVAGWFINRAGASDPVLRKKIIITGNQIETRGDSSLGIIVISDGPTIASNVIRLNGGKGVTQSECNMNTPGSKPFGGVSKTAYISTVDNTGLGTPATWTSKCGSVMFIQYGRELGPGGMNEAGLVIESMGLFRNTLNRKYPDPDDRVSVLAGQWRQYQLDNFTTVKEVIESDAILRIRPQKGIHSHFIVSDKQGNCATIEFLDGKMVCHTGEALPYRALTNNTYEVSPGYLKKDEIPKPDTYKSIERFNRAAKMVKSYNPETSKSPIDYAFNILKSASWSIDREWQGVPYTSDTRWSIVYDQKNLHIHFRNHGNPKIRVIRLEPFDFSCKTPVQALDVKANLSGDVSGKFVDYARQRNRDLIEKSFTKTVFFPDTRPHNWIRWLTIWKRLHVQNEASRDWRNTMKPPLSRREAIQKGDRLLLGASACALMPGVGAGCSQREVDAEFAGRLWDILLEKRFCFPCWDTIEGR